MSLADIKHIEPKSVLDIGANVGGFAFAARILWPGARMFLIEANPACSDQLSACCVWHRTNNNNGGAEMFYTIACLGSKEGERKFYIRKGGGTDTGNSLYRELTPFFSDDQIEVETVNTMTLDFVLGHHESYDLIKLDTQGSELDIIRGGMETAKRAKHILMEVAFVPYNEGAPLAPEVFAFMDSLGFPKCTFVGDIVHPITREVVQKDVLFSK